MDDIGRIVPAHGRDQVLGRGDIVGDELVAQSPPICAWLSTTSVRAGERVHPCALDREIGFDHFDVGMKLAQDRRVALDACRCRQSR